MALVLVAFNLEVSYPFKMAITFWPIESFRCVFTLDKTC